MSPGVIGLAIGAVFGVINYLALSSLAAKAEKESARRLLKLVAVADLVILPALGFVIGTYMWPA